VGPQPVVVCSMAMGARPRPTVIDLFCGAGGLTLGFVRAGFRPVLAVDSDAASCATYAANLCTDGTASHVLHRPIEHVRDFEAAQVIVGGPPCQGFSALGKRDPHDPRNGLWRHYFRAVDLVRPQFLVMENVPELLRSEDFSEFRTHVEAKGYTVVAGVLNAADFGVPQRRRRAIVMAAREGTPTLPQATHGDPSSLDVAAGRLRPWSTVREAIGDLPLEPTGEDWHLGRNPAPTSLERYRAVPPGGNRFDLQRNRPDLTPRCWVEKETGSTDLFGRLWWDRPSVTIRTEFYKPEKGRYLHPEADRPITHREAARLQSFPDSFVWRGSRIEVARQIGNAVPPDLAHALALAVRQHLEWAAGQGHLEADAA
jgi:DNA (cytosine-5)-methyltransferase 1